MMELVLKEVPILMCNLIDMQKKLTIIAEIPLKVSLVSFYTRYIVTCSALALIKVEIHPIIPSLESR